MRGEPEPALTGRTVLITRATGQAEGLEDRLHALGATLIHIPTIEFAPPENWNAVDEAIARLGAYDWIIFTSVNAVDTFMDRAKGLSGNHVAAIGKQTAARLRQWGSEVKLIPDRFRAEGLLERFPADLTGLRILLPRAAVADETLPETLRSRGATVDVVTVYRTRMPESGGRALRRLLAEGTIDCITLTSGSTLENLIAMVGPAAAGKLLSGPAIAVIGPRTRSAVENAGLEVAIEPDAATIPDLVDAIRRYFE